MIQAIEETFPSEIAMNILKFCRHPTAQMIKDAYMENDPLAWFDDSDDDDDEIIKRDWSERSFHFGNGRCIHLYNESYNYEERLNNIKNRILESESDSYCESEHYPEDASVCYVS